MNLAHSEGAIREEISEGMQQQLLLFTTQAKSTKPLFLLISDNSVHVKMVYSDQISMRGCHIISTSLCCNVNITVSSLLLFIGSQIL